MVRILKAALHGRVGLVSVSLTLGILTTVLYPALGAGQRRPSAEDAAPVFSEYRGVQIGMSADDARKKLGRPKEKGETQDLYVFNDTETAQLVYDSAHKVVTLSVDFLSGATGIPGAKAVLGSEVEAKADGSMYKMVRYPKAGYWVSFSRTAGDSPLISVTIQKIE